MIDGNVLAMQRRAVAEPGKRVETKCSRCGGRTSDREGVCACCRRDGKITHLARMRTEQIVGLIEAARVELRRRRDEAEAAVKIAEQP